MSYRLNYQSKIFTLLIILIGLFLRFYLLSKIPLALYHDEMDHVFTGEAIARFGTDITGHWSFWRLIPLQTLNVVAELAGFFHAIGQKIFGYGPAFSHLTNATFGLMTCILLYFFTKKITNNKQIAIWSFIFLLINPWHIYLSRMNYEIVISLFFQLLTLFSFYLIFYNLKFSVTNYKRQLLYFFFFSLSYFFAFFTYHGTKVVLPAVIIGLLFGAFFFQQNYKNKIYYFFSLLSVIIIIFNFIPLWHNYKNNLLDNRVNSEFVISQENQIEILTPYRQESLSFPFQKFFINQPLSLLTEISKRYIFAWDIFRLFSGQESGYQFSLNIHSFYYLSSLIFIIFGFGFLSKLPSSTKTFLLIIIFISPLATALSLSWQSIFRSALLYLILNLIAAMGIYSLFTKIKTHHFITKNFYILIILLFISIETINFGYHYFSRYPIITADNHYFSYRLLSAYLGHKNQEKTYVIVEESPYNYARAYVFYQQLMPQLTNEEKHQFSDPWASTIEINNVVFTKECLELEDKNNLILSSHKYSSCEYDYSSIKYPSSIDEASIDNYKPTINAISSPRDSGAYFYLLKGDLCQNQVINQFIHQTKIDTYQAEKLTLTDFCQNWVKAEPF